MVETNWTARENVTSSRDPRKAMVKYYTKLQDTDNIVCNEDWEIIYIFANEWTPLPITQWQPRE